MQNLVVSTKKDITIVKKVTKSLNGQIGVIRRREGFETEFKAHGYKLDASVKFHAI